MLKKFEMVMFNDNGSKFMQTILKNHILLVENGGLITYRI